MSARAIPSVLCSNLSSRLPPRSESLSRNIAQTRTGAQFELMEARSFFVIPAPQVFIICNIKHLHVIYRNDSNASAEASPSFLSDKGCGMLTKFHRWNFIIGQIWGSTLYEIAARA
jgi:hypothetical protein